MGYQMFSFWGTTEYKPTPSAKVDTALAQYPEAKKEMEFQRSLNKLNEYIKNHTQPSKYAESVAPTQLSGLTPAVDTFFAYTPFAASVFGIRTNQKYAIQAAQIIQYAIHHANVESTYANYFYITAFEKLFTLYNDNSKGMVSSAVEIPFMSILGLDLKKEKDTDNFSKIKKALYQELKITGTPGSETTCRYNNDDQPITSSTLNLEQYLQLRQTWLSIQPVSGQPQPSSSPPAPDSVQRVKTPL